jgi:hypothetical protein
MAKGGQIVNLVMKEDRRAGFPDLPRHDFSQKKGVFFQINDRQLERDAAVMRESWRIDGISVSTEDTMIANLHGDQLGRYPLRQEDLNRRGVIVDSILEWPPAFERGGGSLDRDYSNEI